ncbi:hypothetical protein Taro_016974 [Colocasia esculenta]|uniref:SET domain-containing protein n=1 Tax=Colocasia esculenta TaxID=4460 RepID=A0A843ULW6_COLES|nr:hypothetical protein [Colocasia esculenta]
MSCPKPCQPHADPLCGVCLHITTYCTLRRVSFFNINILGKKGIICTYLNCLCAKYINNTSMDSDLVVASPVEDYFIYIDDLPIALKNEAEKVTRPFLDALGDDYSVYCQEKHSTKVQHSSRCRVVSTILVCQMPKHSKEKRYSMVAVEHFHDKDGQATIIALRPIRKGEEITISYIDEDLPYEERQSLLADYGFKCRCSRCLKEIS